MGSRNQLSNTFTHIVTCNVDIYLLKLVGRPDPTTEFVHKYEGQQFPIVSQ